MILTGPQIEREVRSGTIHISDFDPSNVTTNSYNLRLGPQLLRYTGDVVDPTAANCHELVDIPDSGFLLGAGSFMLGHSREALGSTEFVPIIHARSGTARLGLFVHVTADLIDIGSIGQVTFQLYAVSPVQLCPDISIAQVTFWKPYGRIELYQGKYQGSRGPVASRSYKDHNNRGSGLRDTHRN